MIFYLILIGKDQIKLSKSLIIEFNKDLFNNLTKKSYLQRLIKRNQNSEEIVEKRFKTHLMKI